MEPSLLIAIAALVFSVASPVISEWIRGYFGLKEKTLEATIAREAQNRDFYFRHRAEVIETFIRTAGKAINFQSIETVSDFGSASGEVYLYVDESLWHYIDTIRDSLTNGNPSDAEMAFSTLCKRLSDEEVRFEYKPEPDDSNKRKPCRIKSKRSKSSSDV